jgi:hypothetical protein
MLKQPKPDRIAALEDELKQHDARIKELRAHLDKAETLVSEMREHVEGARKLVRDVLPNRISETLAERRDLVKAAKGLK